MWARVDNRLVHGQVIEAWIPYTGSKTLVIANDKLAGDQTSQAIMALAIPRSVKVFFVSLTEVRAVLSDAGDDTFLLFSNCQAARKVFELGVKYPSLNIGNLHYAPGRRQVCDHVALDDNDSACLRYLVSRGVELDFRCVPNKKVQVRFT